MVIMPLAKSGTAVISGALQIKHPFHTPVVYTTLKEKSK
jgi:hypothetical protein